MPNQPLVSVIMNCYNGEKFLREAIDSVLSQTYKNWELVFWDNCSTDKSAEIAKSYDGKLEYFCGNETVNLYAARVQAIEHAKGDYLSFLDVDDWWHATKLEKQVKSALSCNAALAYSDYILEDQLEEKKSIIYGNRIKKQEDVVCSMASDYTVGLLTLFIKKDAYFQVGGFDQDFHIIGDFDLVLRLAANFPVCCVNEPLAHYRWHGANESIKNATLQINELEDLVKKYRSSGTFSRKVILSLISKIEFQKLSIDINQKKRFRSLQYLFKINNPKFFLKAIAKLVLPVRFIKFLKSEVTP